MPTFRAAALALLLSAAAPVLHAAQVVVGQVGPMSGPEASQGRAYATGMQLYFNAVNGTPAAAGHTYTLARRDDGGRPEDTVAATRALLAEDRPMVLAGYFGNRNLAQLVQSGVLEKERIALVGYRVTEIRPETPLVYNVRAGLREEIQKLTEHLATIGISRLGLVYEDGPGAPALVAAADEAAGRHKAQVVARAAYSGSNATAAADAMAKQAPQAILLVASGAAAAGFIEQYRAAGGVAQLFATSGADIEQMSKRLSEEQMQGVAIAQVTPSPYRIAVPVAKEFADIVARNPKLEVPVSYAMMEGFLAAKVIVEAVRRQGARPTREGLAAALDAMERFDAGGYLVGFKPGARTGSRFVELSIVSSNGRIRQ